MITLLLATRNQHKTEEVRAILGDQFHFLTLTDFPSAPEVIEDANTFAGNATKKAVELAKWLSGSRITHHASRSSRPLVLADDSGLEVDALKGAPGIHSARFAALDSGGSANSTDAENRAKLLRLLRDVPLEKRTARFHCVLALTPVLKAKMAIASQVCYTDEMELQTQLFEGTCEGRIDFAPRGQGGFGYDPLFVPEGYQQTFAEMSEELKNSLSHRAKALMKLRHQLSPRQ